MKVYVKRHVVERCYECDNYYGYCPMCDITGTRLTTEQIWMINKFPKDCPLEEFK